MLTIFSLSIRSWCFRLKYQPLSILIRYQRTKWMLMLMSVKKKKWVLLKQRIVSNSSNIYRIFKLPFYPFFFILMHNREVSEWLRWEAGQRKKIATLNALTETENKSACIYIYIYLAIAQLWVCIGNLYTATNAAGAASLFLTAFNSSTKGPASKLYIARLTTIHNSPRLLKHNATRIRHNVKDEYKIMSFLQIWWNWLMDWSKLQFLDFVRVSSGTIATLNRCAKVKRKKGKTQSLI